MTEESQVKQVPADGVITGYGEIFKRNTWAAGVIP